MPARRSSLDTGRLPLETYELIAEVKRHYGLALRLYYPRHDLVEAYTHANGINAFYESVELRKGCCFVRKVEPLQRALAGRKAWITGLRAAQAATRDGLPVRSFDAANGDGGLEKFNPLAAWSEDEVWAYILLNEVPYNALHDSFYPSIGCAPCTRPITPGEDVRRRVLVSSPGPGGGRSPRPTTWPCRTGATRSSRPASASLLPEPRAVEPGPLVADGEAPWPAIRVIRPGPGNLVPATTSPTDECAALELL